MTEAGKIQGPIDIVRTPSYQGRISYYPTTKIYLYLDHNTYYGTDEINDMLEKV